MHSTNRDTLVMRKSFAKIKSNIPLPNLIEVQSRSFNEFVQLDCLPEERRNVGLEKVFRDIFPINYGDYMSLEYIGYELGTWECVCGSLSGINQRYSWACENCKETRISSIDKNGTCLDCKKQFASYKRCQSCLTRVGIKPALSISDCRSSGQTFSFPLRVRVQLISWEEGVSSDKKKVIKDVKEQDIFFLDLPIMADIYEENNIFKVGNTGTFVINGIDRVIVSQIHRSPGVVFSLNKKLRDQSSGTYSARIIPMRGSWIDFEIDVKDILYVRIDKTKKIPVTTFLQAFGITIDEISTLFYKYNTYSIEDGYCFQKLDDSSIGSRIEKGMLSKEVEIPFLGKKITKEIIKEINSKGIFSLVVKKAMLINKSFLKDVINPATGEVIAKKGDVLTEKIYLDISKIKNTEFSLVSSLGYVLNPIMYLTLSVDKCTTQESAIKEIYNKIYPGDNAPVAEMTSKISNMFFNSKMYDLTKVGRIKINRKLGLSIPEDNLCLTKEDIIATIKYLVALREQGEGEIDDIDNLGNRRVRLVGELLANQVHSGVLRVERIVKERFRMHDANKSITPYDLINAKPLAGMIREFFTTGQLSQFIDQTNPLSEIAHKRRLSSLGPGGVLKDRATYEIRDVHTSHYGRICPIETPEGQAIGLISSLATLAFVNDLGFIETPYHPVVNYEIKQDIVYLDAFKESNSCVAQVEVLKDGLVIDKTAQILSRKQGNFIFSEAKEIEYVDVSPNQIFSVATSLIPFLQHDDAVRALMGSNMQRQAVPLLKAEIPMVGTGMEGSIASASRACITANYSGTVEYVSANKIILKADKEDFHTINDWIANGIETYNLKNFQGSSYGTCVHQRPIVKKGQMVKKNEILTNSTAIINGELSLGTNLLIAYMPWRGYNYEDAIILSKRIVQENLLTSVHIEEYSIDARDTRLGPEEITNDIPNISSSQMESLDENGIVKIGTRIKAGDILVGKVTLKGDIQYSPEEKLLRAIFGEKSREVRDTSLRVPAGVEGYVIDVKVFSRSGARKDERYKDYVSTETLKLKHEFDIKKNILEDMIKNDIISLLSKSSLLEKQDYKNKGIYDLFDLSIKENSIKEIVSKIKKSYEIQVQVFDRVFQERVQHLRRGDQLPSGVLKMVKVYIASMRHMQVGDKMAGRHGNKGVVSLILPREDMPFMEDGTPVDVILNPLSVPSRMNIGQILEMILGMCGKKLGEKVADLINKQNKDSVFNELENIFGKKYFSELKKGLSDDEIYDIARIIAKNGVYFATPVFDSGSFEEDIKPLVKYLGLPESGTYKLRDGRTGEYFDQTVTVGVMYIMKLNHMVDDKLHARSVGPYSLVTQQPLGGKAQMGGQRFGEMEVWALEAYGAAYMLQELLTYKSDDVSGRHKVYDALVRGERVPEPGLPESFNVLIKELQALGLKVELFKSDKENACE
jgi:DNA-directed RNA polymerase subunit beta